MVMWMKRFFSEERLILFGLTLVLFFQSPSSFGAAKKGVKVSSEFNYNKVRPMPVSCIGPEDAEHFMVYLHGADLGHIGPYERENRVALEEIANTLKIRIAVPRATSLCSGTVIGEVCWWVFDHPELVERTMTQVLDARESCFPRSQPFGILGFSNGGYLLNHWFVKNQCSISSGKDRKLPSWMIAFSAIGIGGQPLEEEQHFDGSHCPALQYVIGDRDLNNFDRTFYHHLQMRGARLLPVDMFKGKHELEPKALYHALEKIFHNKTHLNDDHRGDATRSLHGINESHK